jgi:hypothetical protein
MGGLQRALYRASTLVMVALILFQGWYGGEMVYAHGASVAAAGQGVEMRQTASKRLRAVAEFLGVPHGSGHGAGDTGQAPAQ